MAKMNYNFWYIRRDDDIHISECAIRLSEGDVTTENERVFSNTSITGVIEPVTRYRKTKRLQATDVPAFNGKIKKERSGDDTFIFTPNDFGVISTEDELEAFLNKEMKKETSRDNVDFQMEEDPVKVRERKELRKQR